MLTFYFLYRTLCNNYHFKYVILRFVYDMLKYVTQKYVIEKYVIEKYAIQTYENNVYQQYEVSL